MIQTKALRAEYSNTLKSKNNLTSTVRGDAEAKAIY